MAYQLPDRMTDRWRHRPEIPEDHGTVYWHLLVDDTAPVRQLVATAQDTLSAFPGLHLTPQRWLHVTILPIGPRNEISADLLADLLGEARHRLHQVPPIRASVGRVLYHPEAVAVAVRPRWALAPLYDIAGQATRTTLRGPSSGLDVRDAEWLPHITLAYGTTDQPAGPIIDALGRDIEEHELLVTEMSLVVQWGPEQAWNWEVIGAARLGSDQQ